MWKPLKLMIALVGLSLAFACGDSLLDSLEQRSAAEDVSGDSNGSGDDDMGSNDNANSTGDGNNSNDNDNGPGDDNSNDNDNESGDDNSNDNDSGSGDNNNNSDGSGSGNNNGNSNGSGSGNTNNNGNTNDTETDPPPPTTQFKEVNGYVVMETESVGLTMNLEWDMQAELDGYTGDGYYQFVGNGICNGPANSPLEYTFTISTAGRYELRLRAAKITHCVAWQDPGAHSSDTETTGCNHTEGTCDSLAFPSGNACPDPTMQCLRSDISNDAFVHIRDASDTYMPFVDQPANSVGNGIKLFGGNSNQWAWTGTNAFDTNDEKWAAHWDLAPGEYTLIVEGRSQLFRIDRMILFDVDRTSGTDGAIDLPETLSR